MQDEVVGSRGPGHRAEVGIAADVQRAGTDRGAAAISVDPGQGNVTSPRLSEPSCACDNAGVVKRDRGVGGEGAAAAAKTDAAVGADDSGGAGLQGAAVEDQGAGSHGAGHRAEVGIAADDQRAGTDRGAAAISVGASERQSAGTRLGEGPRARNRTREGLDGGRGVIEDGAAGDGECSRTSGARTTDDEATGTDRGRAAIGVGAV